jgi:hypothetical protein
VTAANGPYALPHTLEGELTRVHAFWNGLKRHEAEMPFWDDVKISALPELAARLMMIEATDKPVRFRVAYGLVGADIRERYGHDLSGIFSTRSTSPLRCNFCSHNAAPRSRPGRRLITATM